MRSKNPKAMPTNSRKENSVTPTSRRAWLRAMPAAVAILALALPANPAHSQIATPTATTIMFSPANVGVSEGSAQTLTASFQVSGYSGTFTPTAKLHYGLSYTTGAVNCTGGASPETCTVPVTFQPQYPGGRREALFLMNGTTRLATVLIYGIGQSPFALIQPGEVTNPILASVPYLYQSVVDENGTVYVLETGSNAVESVTKSGVVTTLPVTGLNSPRSIGIDGAGVLYFADQTFNGPTITFDTIQGTQGTVPFPAPSIYVQGIGVGNTGNIYETDGLNVYTKPIVGLGTAGTKAISPAITQAYMLTVDSNENVFVGGYETNEITSGGVQTQINTNGSGDGLATDAADTVYATRYTGTSGVAELPASGYSTLEAAVDLGSSPLGTSVGPDGTVYVSNYNNLDKVDRSQGVIAFGEQFTGVVSTPLNIMIYNGGNQPLTVSNFAIAGTGFALQAATSNNCTIGIVIAPGALCQIAVTETPPHAGTFTGTLTVTSNTLNTAATAQTVALTGFAYGVYVTETPNPINFPPQIVGTTSAPMTATLTNSGDLYFAGIGVSTSTSPVYSVTLGTCSAGIAVGGNCNLNITFTPTAAQTYNGVTITVPYASSGGGAPPPPVTFTVNGTGTPAAAPLAVLSPNPFAVPGTIVGEATTLPITLSNPGTAALTITGISVTGTNASNFGQTNNCGASLAAGSTCTITVTFTPTSAISFNASISVADNASGSPHTDALTGTGISFVSNVGTALAAQPVALFFPTGGTLNVIQVLTQGAPGLDFTLSSGGTCATGTIYTTGQFCTVNVVFMPKFAGSRQGTVLLTDSSGNALASTYLPGTGLGPQIVFGPGVQSTIVALSANYVPTGVAVDGTGNIYFANSNFSAGTNGVFKMTKSGTTYGAPVALGSGYNGPIGLAVDGPGNVYVGDYGNYRVVKIPWTGSAYGAQTTVPLDSKPFREPRQVFVDSLGNVYFADFAYGTVVEIPWTGTGYGTLVTLPFTGLNGPNGVAVDVNGDVFCADSSNHRVLELPHTSTGFGAQTTVATVASTNIPFNLALDGSGDIYVSEQFQSVTGGIVAQIPWNGSVYGAPVTLNVAGLGYAPYGVATDGSGNLVVGGGLNGTVFRLDRSDPPALSFAATTVGSTSSDSPQTVTVQNIGNVTFVFTVPGTGTNPSYPVNFPVNTADTSRCSFGLALAQSATCDVSVNFTPTTSGSFTGNIVLTDDQLNVVNAMQSIAVSGTGNAALAPQAVLSPNPLAFPSTTVGTSAATMPMTLSNPGTAALTITSISATGANPNSFSQTNNCGASLAVAATCTITVTFTPGSAAALTAAISVADNATGSPQSATLTGTGIAAVPLATLSPNPLAFPTTTVGSTATALPVTLSNTGTGTLTGISVSITGTNPGDFATTPATTCGTTLAAATSCTVYVSFTPASATGFTATLSVADNATSSPQTVTLTGTGSAAPAPQAVLSPNLLAFPNAPVGTSSATMPMTLSNPGTAALTITSISVTGANAGSFSQTNNCPASLAAAATCTITVTFTPGSAAALTAAISVADNVTGSPQSAVLTGTGTAPQATLSVTTLTFPGTPVGTSAGTASTMLSNPGTAPLAITSISISGTNSSSFAQANNCGTSVAVGATCTITVTFTPASAGSLGASVSVADNASGSPQTVALTGTGTAPQAALSPNPLAFPSTTVGISSATMPMTLSNPGNVALTITSISVSGTNAGSFGQTNTCPASLAAAATCTITVTFTPASAAALTAAISVADNATGSPQSATLTGTGTAPLIPQAVLSPNPLAFPSTSVGTSSATMPMTLSNPGTAPLTITGISITGANAGSFGQTNNCPASLAAAATCTITVTFTPASAAALTAAISVADNAAGSPQSVTLTGTGSAGTYTVASSTPSASVQPGAVAQYNIQIMPFGGSYNNLVTLSATGLPAGAQASFLPPAVTPGSTGAQSVMSIQTPSGLARLATPQPQRQNPLPLLAIFAGIPLLGFAGSLRRLRRSSRRCMLLGLAALAILPTLAISGCGGGYFGPVSRTYTVTVIGTSGSLQQSTTISLTVQ